MSSWQENCPATIQPDGAPPVRCLLAPGGHELHDGMDREPPRIRRQWLDSNSWVIVDSQGDRVKV